MFLLTDRSSSFYVTSRTSTRSCQPFCRRYLSNGVRWKFTISPRSTSMLPWKKLSPQPQYWRRREMLRTSLYQSVDVSLLLMISSLSSSSSSSSLGRLNRLTLLSRPTKASLDVRLYVLPQEGLPIWMKFGVWVEVDEWSKLVCPVTRSKVRIRVMSSWKLEIVWFSKSISCDICNGRWQVTADS